MVAGAATVAILASGGLVGVIVGVLVGVGLTGQGHRPVGTKRGELAERLGDDEEVVVGLDPEGR